MKFDKHFGERREEKPLTTILVGKFDARDEMDRAVRRLELTMIKPMQSNLIRKPEEEARIAKDQYDRNIAQVDDRNIAQVDLAERQYLERLEQAKKAGAIDNDDYFRAKMDVSSPFSSFGRMRTEAREAYRDVVKFG